MRALLCAFLIAVFAAPCVAEKIHDSDWKTGKLTDIRFERDSRIVGVGDVVTQRRNDSTFYEIDAGNLVYVVKQTLRHRGRQTTEADGKRGGKIRRCEGRFLFAR